MWPFSIYLPACLTEATVAPAPVSGPVRLTMAPTTPVATDSAVVASQGLAPPTAASPGSRARQSGFYNLVCSC